MQFISGVKVVHAADKAERHRCRLLRQDDAKPWSKEQAAIKIDDLPLQEVRGLLTLDGLAGGSRTEQAAMVSPRVTSCAINNAPFRVFGKKRESGRFHPGGMKAA